MSRHEVQQVQPKVPVWRCRECGYTTDDLTKVAKHVVANQYTERDRA